MRWTTGTKDSPVTQEIEVKLDWVNHVAVNNSAGHAISASVGLIFLAREKANVMPLANDN